MKTVADTLRAKPHQTVYSVNPSTTVLAAIALMAETKVGALLVLDNEKLVGIVSERDYVRKMVLQGRSSFATPVRDIMTEEVITVDLNATNQHCMELMTQNHLRHLPVMQDDKVIGLLSIGDLVKGIIEEQQKLIDHLEQYIRG